MATFEVNFIPPPTLTGLAAMDTLQGPQLEWTNPLDVSNLIGVEVWASTTNDRSAATLIKTLSGSNYLYTMADSNDHYFWVKGIGKDGQSNGEWCPVSATDGVLAKRITLNAIVSIRQEILAIDPTFDPPVITLTGDGAGANSSWCPLGSIDFTAFRNGVVSGQIIVSVEPSRIQVPNADWTMKVFVRTRLHDNDFNYDVPGTTNVVLLGAFSGSATGDANYSFADLAPYVNHHISATLPFRFNSMLFADLVSGETYVGSFGELFGAHTLFIEVMRETTSAATLPMTGADVIYTSIERSIYIPPSPIPL